MTPRGALRWTSAQLRRALGIRDALRGDPLELGLPADAFVGALALGDGDADHELARGELLEGVTPDAGATFDAWLLVERRRPTGLCEAVLRDAALSALAAGNPRDGAALASRALALNEFDETAHELLVRCLAQAGEIGAARHHVTACEVLFRRRSGVRPSLACVTPPTATPREDRARSAIAWPRSASSRPGARRWTPGATDPGVACLRQACAEARGVGDPALLARTLTALGIALVHAVRGRDEEGAAILHEALALAQDRGDRAVAGKICRELGFVDVQAGRGVSAGRWLLRAGRLAATDAERAAVLGVRGMALSDRAHYAAAIVLITESVATARRCGDLRQAAWSLAILGRARLLRGDIPAAKDALEESLALVAAEGWVAFAPFPEALRAEVALHEQDTEHAAALLEHAFALGCQLADPCWEAMAARAQGLQLAADGRRDSALTRLNEAATRAARVADPYVWVQAHCLDALAGVAIAEAAPDADTHVSHLELIAGRGDMRELVVRAALHRARLGDPAAIGSARVRGDAIDNPRLRAELAAAG